MDHPTDTMLNRIIIIAGCGVLFIGIAFAFRPGERSDIDPPPAFDSTDEPKDLREELRRCRQLGPDDRDDAHCRAIWAENRRRFFARSAKPFQNGSVSEAPAQDARDRDRSKEQGH
jgi:conjugative transfer region protein TrbK